jgi:uncharacterized membrane protein
MNKISLTVLILLLFAQIVSADTVSDVNIRVDEGGFAQVEKRLILEGGGDYGIVYAPEHAGELAITLDGESIDYELTEINGQTAIKIIFSKDVAQKSSKDVLLSYETHYLTTKEADTWTLYYETSSTPRKTIVRVSLPTDSNLTSIKPDSTLLSLSHHH